MKRVIPDNVVFNDDKGYNASLLSYPTNVGAPVIHIDNLVSWKSRGISTVNKQFENKLQKEAVQPRATDTSLFDQINSIMNKRRDKIVFKKYRKLKPRNNFNLSNSGKGKLA